MRKLFLGFVAVAAVFLGNHASAATRFVDINSTNPVSPYTNWMTAATNIQDAINAPGSFSDTVLVTNGTYEYGSSGASRVSVTSGITLQSVNGPAVTIIKGSQVPGTTNGPGALRCVSLSEFAKLYGFTLTGGATASSGSSSSFNGGGITTASQCIISNCVIAGNSSASSGGGAYLGGATAMIHCILSGNTAFNAGSAGGGAASSIGGSPSATLINCIVSNNIAASGGGVANCAVINSLLVGNGTTNSAGTTSGAAYLCTLNNCTIAGNVSQNQGAVAASLLFNSIIYYNFNNGYADCYQCLLSNCCTTIGLGTSTLPKNCFSNSPGFLNPGAGDYHLNPWSRCLDAGNSALATNNFDLDGNSRITGAAVDLGAYENQSAFPGAAHYVSLLSTNPVAPYTNWSTAATNLQDGVGAAQAGEFVIADDGVYTNSGTVVSGAETNRVVLTNGVTLTSVGGPQASIIAGGTQMRCAYLGSNSTLIGFTLTNGHARIMGDFVNEESGGGAWCEIGGTISNCVIAGNSCPGNGANGGGVYRGRVYDSIISSNNAALGGGAAAGIYFNCTFASNAVSSGNSGGGIYGGVASNCTFIANGKYYGIIGGGACLSTLYHCLVASNSSTYGGGGADSSILYNCTLQANQSATGGGGTRNSSNYSCTFLNNSSSNGGGARGGYAYNCVFTGNSADVGGGADACALLNCTVVGNTATNNRGGVVDGTGSPVVNSIVYYNTCLNNPATANGPAGTTFSSCTTPLPFLVAGCFTNEPLLVNWTNGDFHLQSNSPCINAGDNTFVTNHTIYPVLTNDFEGNPRIIRGAVDVGACEVQSPASALSYAWLLQYGFALDGSADNADADGDGVVNYAEWRAKTNPTNSASVLSLQTPVVTDTNATITWQSVSGVRYYVQNTPDLFAQPFQTIASNIFGSAGTTSFKDTNAVPGARVFYRVGVQ